MIKTNAMKIFLSLCLSSKTSFCVAQFNHFFVNIFLLQFYKKKPLSCIVAKISFKLRAFCKMITAKSFYFCYFSFSDGFCSLRLLWRIIAIFLKDTIRFIFSVIEDKKYLKAVPQAKENKTAAFMDWLKKSMSEWVSERDVSFKRSVPSSIPFQVIDIELRREQQEFLGNIWLDVAAIDGDYLRCINETLWMRSI